MGTFHACSNTWKYDLKNISQRKIQIFLYEDRTLSFVLYDWYSQHSRKRPPLMQDKVVAYAERWSSTGKN